MAQKITNSRGAEIFAITDTSVYAMVVILLTQYNSKLITGVEIRF